MMKIEKEDFGSDITDIDHIGRIGYGPCHYYYRDHNGTPHNGQFAIYDRDGYVHYVPTRKGLPGY